MNQRSKFFWRNVREKFGKFLWSNYGGEIDDRWLLLQLRASAIPIFTALQFELLGWEVAREVVGKEFYGSDGSKSCWRNM
jgi:hypothetical protein